MPYRRFANVETNLFPALSKQFQADGVLHPLDLWAILKWKANRKATAHLDRFERMGLTFEQASLALGRGIFESADPAGRLQCLIEEWGFRLPTATAILTVLYPTEFTVYDIRVCNTLERFHHWGGRRYSQALWVDYQAFKSVVIAAAPKGASLREADHYLWGKSWETDARVALGLSDIS